MLCLRRFMILVLMSDRLLVLTGRGSGNATPCGGVSPGGGFLSPTGGSIAPSQDSSGGPSTNGTTPRSRGCEKNLTKTFEAVTAAAAAGSADDGGAAGVNKHHNLFLQLSQQNNHAFQVLHAGKLR